MIIGIIIGILVGMAGMWAYYNVERPKDKGYWDMVEESNSTL